MKFIAYYYYDQLFIIFCCYLHGLDKHLEVPQFKHRFIDCSMDFVLIFRHIIAAIHFNYNLQRDTQLHQTTHQNRIMVSHTFKITPCLIYYLELILYSTSRVMKVINLCINRLCGRNGSNFSECNKG